MIRPTPSEESDTVTSRGKAGWCKPKEEETLWHLRLGHDSLHEAVRSCTRTGILSHVKCSTIDFKHFAKEKYCRSFPGSLSTATEVGRLDVNTNHKVDVKWSNGLYYFVPITAKRSHYTQSFPIKS